MHCDGCGMVKASVQHADARGFVYCDDCAARRKGDPVVAVNGRVLVRSELEMQAEDDKHLANALQGDTVQEQFTAQVDMHVLPVEAAQGASRPAHKHKDDK